MRKQYHSRQIGADTHIWDVHKLVRSAQTLPVRNVPLDQISELDENWWYHERGAVPSPRSLVDHMQLVQSADLSYPIILCAEGRLMDGMHRVAKALLEMRSHIPARRFQETPPPDFLNVSLNDLPYPDEPI